MDRMNHCGWGLSSPATTFPAFNIETIKSPAACWSGLTTNVFAAVGRTARSNPLHTTTTASGDSGPWMLDVSVSLEP